ncbi:MAG: TonB-dependent receptor domain-containing protein, partial [Acidimicrobiia bacterium]
PQTSSNVSLNQNVFSIQYDTDHTKGHHLLKAGALVEHYRDDMFNPTFSLGIFNFPSLQRFLLNQPQQFVGLTPQGDLERFWPFTLFGFYVQDDVKASKRLTVNLGLRYEFSTLPKDQRGRDSALPNLTDTVPVTGQLYENPTFKNLSPRAGLAWDLSGNGRTALRGGYGLYFNTNNQQNLIVTVTNPPATPRIVLPNPTFPVPSFDQLTGLSIRPVQFDLENPRVHVWNVSLQHELRADTVVTVGYAGSRGRHLLRSSDVNLPTPQRLDDGSVFFPGGLMRPNRAFTTIELKTSDGNSWYKALVVEVRRRWTKGFSFQSSYTFASNIDTTQASTFFSDATNGTTSAFPEFIPDYNKGPADYDARHNWVVNLAWDVPFAKNLTGVARALLHGWQLAGIAQMRSGNPLTVFVSANRSRSQWLPSLGPGIGRDRPNLAPGRTPDSAILGLPDRYFDPDAFVLQPAGTFGNSGRGT